MQPPFDMDRYSNIVHVNAPVLQLNVTVNLTVYDHMAMNTGLVLVNITTPLPLGPITLSVVCYDILANSTIFLQRTYLIHGGIANCSTFAIIPPPVLEVGRQLSAKVNLTDSYLQHFPILCSVILLYLSIDMDTDTTLLLAMILSQEIPLQLLPMKS